ncbi:hypothetical protein yaldo0001_18430 [Yersinia aldovae ATCC 35236]|nr:hypothetical protein yaldo0001_18430 [Yersinia aldovae ATCC 35236]
MVINSINFGDYWPPIKIFSMGIAIEVCIISSIVSELIERNNSNETDDN